MALTKNVISKFYFRFLNRNKNNMQNPRVAIVMLMCAVSLMVVATHWVIEWWMLSPFCTKASYRRCFFCFGENTSSVV